MKVWVWWNRITKRQPYILPKLPPLNAMNPTEWIIRPWGVFKRGTEAGVLAERIDQIEDHIWNKFGELP